MWKIHNETVHFMQKTSFIYSAAMLQKDPNQNMNIYFIRIETQWQLLLNVASTWRTVTTSSCCGFLLYVCSSLFFEPTNVRWFFRLAWCHPKVNLACKPCIFTKHGYQYTAVSLCLFSAVSRNVGSLEGPMTLQRHALALDCIILSCYDTYSQLWTLYAA